MIVELWAERDGVNDRMLKRWSASNVEVVKAEVETLLSRWEDEMEDWSSPYEGEEASEVCSSRVLPGFEEGDDAVLKIDGKTEWMYTDRWEVYRI